MRNFELRQEHDGWVRELGTDHISNLQLLYTACNSLRGTKSHEELLVLLTDKGWIKRRKKVAMSNKKTRPADWSEILKGATPEAVARALLRPRLRYIKKRPETTATEGRGK